MVADATTMTPNTAHYDWVVRVDTHTGHPLGWENPSSFWHGGQDSYASVIFERYIFFRFRCFKNKREISGVMGAIDLPLIIFIQNEWVSWCLRNFKLLAIMCWTTATLPLPQNCLYNHWYFSIYRVVTRRYTSRYIFKFVLFAWPPCIKHSGEKVLL